MISVIMLTLKKAAYLSFAVASVLESQDVELILVCPNEQDDSFSLFPSFIELYGDRIQIVCISDKSPAEGLNNGLAAIRGNIVGILNGDDFYLPGGLNFVNQAFRLNPELDLLLCGGLIVDQDSNLVKHVIPGNIKYATQFHDFQGTFTFLHQSMFYKRKKFNEFRFNENNHKNWDTEFLLRILQTSPTLQVSNNAIAAFRLTKENITSQSQFTKAQKKRDLSMDDISSKQAIYFRFLAPILRAYKFMVLMKWAITCQLTRENYRKQ